MLSLAEILCLNVFIKINIKYMLITELYKTQKPITYHPPSQLGKETKAYILDKTPQTALREEAQRHVIFSLLSPSSITSRRYLNASTSDTIMAYAGLSQSLRLSFVGL
jgi:hypothetical protein